MHLDVQATYGLFTFNQFKNIWELHSVYKGKDDALQKGSRIKEGLRVRVKVAYGRVLGIDFIYKNDAENVTEL